MSHIVTIQTEVRDRAAVFTACRRLRLSPPREGTARLFSSEATGLLVELPRWRYPLVCQIETGTLAYDNYRGAWGEPVHLDRFLQAYAVEKSCRSQCTSSNDPVRISHRAFAARNSFN